MTDARGARFGGLNDVQIAAFCFTICGLAQSLIPVVYAVAEAGADRSRSWTAWDTQRVLEVFYPFVATGAVTLGAIWLAIGAVRLRRTFGALSCSAWVPAMCVGAALAVLAVMLVLFRESTIRSPGIGNGNLMAWPGETSLLDTLWWAVRAIAAIWVFLLAVAWVGVANTIGNALLRAGEPMHAAQWRRNAYAPIAIAVLAMVVINTAQFASDGAQVAMGVGISVVFACVGWRVMFDLRLARFRLAGAALRRSIVRGAA